MKNSIGCLLFLSAVTVGIAQNLGVDKSGYSTIYTKGANVSFNLVESQLHLDYFDATQWKRDPKKEVWNAYFYGASIAANANEGIGELISKGNLNAGANAEVVFGFKTHRLRADPLGVSSRESEKAILDNRNTQNWKNLYMHFRKLKGSIASVKNSLWNDFVNTYVKKSARKKLLKINASTTETSVLETALKGKLITVTGVDEAQAQFFLVAEQLDSLLAQREIFTRSKGWDNFVTSLEKLEEIEGVSLPEDLVLQRTKCEQFIQDIGNVEKALLALKRKSHTYVSSEKWLIKLGVNQRDFDLDVNAQGQTIEERIQHIRFTSMVVELLYNLQINYNHFIGVGLRAERSNNFNALNEQEISFTDTNGNSQVVKAYQGSYETFMKYAINADYMYLKRLNKDPKNYSYLILNPYLRHAVFKGNSQLSSQTNVGIGLNLFNSKADKVLGGAYVQLNDVLRMNTDDPLRNGVSFGLVLKYAFSGFDFEEKVE